MRTGTPRSDAVRRAVRTVLDDGSHRHRARTLQTVYAQRDGVTEIAGLLDEVIAERHAEPQSV
jgi:UDP:flavonoid glycosyltransferase YjiC (YdhE family)